MTKYKRRAKAQRKQSRFTPKQTENLLKYTVAVGSILYLLYPIFLLFLSTANHSNNLAGGETWEKTNETNFSFQIIVTERRLLFVRTHEWMVATFHVLWCTTFKKLKSARNLRKYLQQINLLTCLDPTSEIFLEYS